MLYAIEIPEDGGGDTSFANQYMAYETLPDVMKLTIAGKAQVHDSSRNSAGVLRPTAKLPSKPEEVEGPTHPLVRIHPDTGRQALYLGRRRVWPSNYIVGLENEKSEACWIGFGVTRRRTSSFGHIPGAQATFCCGTIAAPCTTGPNSTTLGRASSIEHRFRAKP